MIEDQRSASRAYFKAILWRTFRYALLLLVLAIFARSASFRSEAMRILFGGGSQAARTQPESTPGEEKKTAEEPGALAALGKTFFSATGALIRGAAAVVFGGMPPDKQPGSQAEGEKSAQQATSPTPPAAAPPPPGRIESGSERSGQSRDAATDPNDAATKPQEGAPGGERRGSKSSRKTDPSRSGATEK